MILNYKAYWKAGFTWEEYLEHPGAKRDRPGVWDPRSTGSFAGC